MGGENNWMSMGAVAKSCDSCKSAPATLFCRADSTFLCVSCDGEIHAANKLASRHARVWLCEVCEQAPASVTCKADAAALCVTCDRDIHSANPLARRHERFPIVPFYDSAAKSRGVGGRDNEQDDPDAEAASWILHNVNETESKISEQKTGVEYLFNDLVKTYLDVDYKGEKKIGIGNVQKSYNNDKSSLVNADGVVPVQQPDLVDGFPAYDHFDYAGSKPFMYNFTSQSICSQSVSSSSLEVDLVPDHNALADVSNNTVSHLATTEALPSPISGLDREARVMRYREKRKNRKFEKTVRYASRKAFAETRPRIKGRFAKRTEIDVEALITADTAYGVVPSY